MRRTRPHFASRFGGIYRSVLSGEPGGKFWRRRDFFLNGNKMIPTSGGRAGVSHDENVAKNGRYLTNQAREVAIHYEHTQAGYNYRFNITLAALGRVQLRKLDDFVAMRKNLRDRYRPVFADVGDVGVFGAPMRLIIFGLRRWL